MEKKYKFFVCIALLISLLTTTVNLSCYADKLININTETKMIKDANELIDCVENTVTLKYAKTPYKSTEIFQVEFIANTELKDDYSKEIIYNIKTYANSFEIISSNADYKNNTITVSLKYLNDDTYPIFTIEIQSGNATIIGKIYGYNTKYGLFISPSSYYAARDNYYTYAIDNKIITKEEYEEIIAIDSRNGVKEESWTTSAENSDSKSRNTYVAGTLKWEDGNSIDHPLKYTKIQIYDKDAIGSDDLLGTVYTNSTGNYSFTFQNQLFDRQDIYIKVYPEGEGTKVLTDNGNAYIYVSPISNNVSTGSTTHKNFTAHMDEDDMQKAFQISQSVIFAAKYAKQMHDNPMSNVEVYYPHGTGNCSYSSTYKRINITGANSSHPDGLQSYASWDVIMHEYGHHVQHELDIILHDGSSHGPGLNIADQLYNNRANNGYTEEECKEIGMGIGWSEAWATVFGNLAQEYYETELTNIDYVNDISYDAYNGVSFNLAANTYNNGDSDEGAIIKFLWNMYDSNNSSIDNVTLGHDGFWDVAVDDNNFGDFTNTLLFYDSDNYVTNYGSLLTFSGIASNIVFPLTSMTLYSYNLPTFTWSAGGGTGHYYNNSFSISFYDSLGNNIISFVVNGSSTTISYTLTSFQWSQIVNAPGNSFTIGMLSHKTNYFCGWYISEQVTYNIG